MPTYEDVDETFEYLDLSCRSMGVQGISEILDDIEDDTLLKHLDLSFNMTADEAEQPSKMKLLFSSIARAFKKNKTLTGSFRFACILLLYQSIMLTLLPLSCSIGPGWQSYVR
jgi:hypothetical protein